MMECEVSLGVNSQVIHVYFQPSFSNHVCENVVHKGLEGGWSIAKAEELDSWFKECKRSDECSFPLVFFLNANVVESPSDVKLSKDHRVLHVINQFGNKEQGICIADGMGV